MSKTYRDGVEHTLDEGSKIRVRVTSDGHVIESWMSGGKRVYFANLNKSVYCAHGATEAQAIADAIWKDPAKRPSLEALATEIRKTIETRKITLNEFRLLTGACLSGCEHFLKQHGLGLDVQMTLSEFKPIGGEWARKLETILLT